MGRRLSFAGQHETFLNIVGVDPIMQAGNTLLGDPLVQSGTLEYRRKQGLSGERLQLAVLVQQLVASDVSAVVFSCQSNHRQSR